MIDNYKCQAYGKIHNNRKHDYVKQEVEGN